MRKPLLATCMSLAIAFGGCGQDSPNQGSGNIVHDYCAYGAVSQAQLDGCESHITESTAASYNTNAGRYARGELDNCLTDAGPFCKER